MAYYPDWVSDDYPPEKIDFGRFDWIDFAFAVPDSTFNLSWDGSDDAPDTLRRLVQRAHASGKRVKLSVGGWTGSTYFSSAAATPQGRTTLANNIYALYLQFGLDGIDIDWEYPGQGGNSGNGVSPDDSANFLEFLRILRSTLPPDAVITAATQTVPFADSDGNPMQDVSEFARVLDWVLLMNYDTWGSSSDPGPNAPLSNACGNSTQGSANALSALQAWTAAGFAAHQLVLGVPSYGYLSRSTDTVLQTRALRRRRQSSGASRDRHWLHRQRQRQRRRRSPVPAALEWFSSLADVLPGAVRVKNEDGGSDDGQVQFRELVKQGVIQAYSSSPAATTPADGSSLHVDSTDASNSTDGSTTTSSGALRLAIENAEPRSLFAGDKGFVRMWDACSSTPYLRSAGAGQVVAYDDPVSLEMKAQLVRQAGMRGVNVFDVHGDTDAWDLTDAVRRGLGLV
ncbi:glycoside hydrolase [Lentinus tigrinus ALCF2SS1-7]|uniref:Glycoside hydrolase n=1 Tax=Lentinus tigrinus ALCF2SS1-6 TaxID=1328759 RepID=A0A5C2SW40_9APHY|nr:glycoside hydrolase [Lentinus tigrinus ALCF2SS1-6]RPD81197.1 glycoside hydrolase [Lentinus tigrinus ALCF2SS1-7]